MKIRSFLLAVAGITLAACQSNSYRISGTAEGLADGDTLFLTTNLETGIPRDTLLVKDHHFELEGTTDSTYFCLIYSKSNEAMAAPFFIEPGTIRVQFTKEPVESRVGGTLVNDEWQRLNDSIAIIGKEMNRLAEQVYGQQVSEEKQQRAMAEIERLNERFSRMVVAAAERNVKNELGYFLLTFYPETIIPDEERLRLLKLLPDQMRQRPLIQQIEQQIGNVDNISEGSTILDFTMPTLADAPLSIMSEISKNRLTVIDFWASWCAPCRQEMPFMLALYKEYKGRGLGIVGISLDESKEAWQKATDQLAIPWPQMSDLKGWGNAAAQTFNVTSIPHTIVVDQQGKILNRGLRGEQLEQFM